MITSFCVYRHSDFRSVLKVQHQLDLLVDVHCQLRLFILHCLVRLINRDARSRAGHQWQLRHTPTSQRTVWSIGTRPHPAVTVEQRKVKLLLPKKAGQHRSLLNQSQDHGHCVGSDAARVSLLWWHISVGRLTHSETLIGVET